MASIYFFRGKAATGKTTITDILSKHTKITVLRKDDLFDALTSFTTDSKRKNSISYEVLAKLIQTNIDNEVDVIVDVGLADNSDFMDFISKINFKKSNKIFFYCDCSNIEMWRSRFEKRLKNPAPNHCFSSVDEIINHYKHCEVNLLEDEIYIDSTEELNKILDVVYSYIKLARIL